jgi:hypothetical protein
MEMQGFTRLSVLTDYIEKMKRRQKNMATRGEGASIWFNAINAPSPIEEIRRLSYQDDAKAVINDTFSVGPVSDVTPLEYAILRHEPVESLALLVDVAGAKVTNPLLTSADYNFKQIEFLHSRGARFEASYLCSGYLGQLYDKRGETAVVEFIFFYPHYWHDLYIPHMSSDISSFISIARHRTIQTHNACMAVAGLAYGRKKYMCKDMVKKIMRYMKAPSFVAKEEWGKPPSDLLRTHREGFYFLLFFVVAMFFARLWVSFEERV